MSFTSIDRNTIKYVHKTIVSLLGSWGKKASFGTNTWVCVVSVPSWTTIFITVIDICNLNFSNSYSVYAFVSLENAGFFCLVQVRLLVFRFPLCKPTPTAIDDLFEQKNCKFAVSNHCLLLVTCLQLGMLSPLWLSTCSDIICAVIATATRQMHVDLPVSCLQLGKSDWKVLIFACNLRLPRRGRVVVWL